MKRTELLKRIQDAGLSGYSKASKKTLIYYYKNLTAMQKIDKIHQLEWDKKKLTKKLEKVIDRWKIRFINKSEIPPKTYEELLKRIPKRSKESISKLKSEIDELSKEINKKKKLAKKSHPTIYHKKIGYYEK